MLTAEERIAHLMARAQAERLAAEVAIFEARGQLAPLRSAAGVLQLAVRALSPKGTAGSLIATGSRYLVGHPWLASALTAGALRHRCSNRAIAPGSTRSAAAAAARLRNDAMDGCASQMA